MAAKTKGIGDTADSSRPQNRENKPKIQVIETPVIKCTGWKVDSKPRFTILIMDEKGIWHMIFKLNLSAKKINKHFIS